MNLLRIHSSLTPVPRRPFRGWIFYDGTCGLCTALRDKWAATVEPRGFRLAALQEPWVQQRLGLHGDIPPELKLETPDGRFLGGGDAFLYIARFIWWAWPLWLLAQLPGIPPLLRTLYRPIATHRHRLSRACGLKAPAARGRATEKWLD
jgi:predicted DCC family thiol-disulfide oxidoreductase YuxK